MFLRLISALAALLTAAPHTAHTAPPAHSTVVAPRTVRAAAPTPRPVNGGDVSWPNCPRSMGIAGRHGYALPMPNRAAHFVVVGATNGPAFTPNPCLRNQVRWVKHRHLWISAYAVIHFPRPSELRNHGGRGSSATRVGRAGAAEARHALRTLHHAGLRPTMVWIDVETVGGHPWSKNRVLNRALIRGAARQFQRAHIKVGIYSYKYAWNRITGGWHTRLPTWVPSGSGHRSHALARCGQRSFSGGRVLLTQWTTHGRDFDLTCPGVARHLKQLFRKL